ncbi:hypothetical protein F0562_011111 [Nyssa sinensis]|uniref:T-complex protein 1 subunit delta n=1 Tax=Nyssa sinensis TaxID=561372 RepID=A0A5J5A3X0_9ASTE|nr:hypothetical protein F0562_011111 [Nyssa sinensis]
MTILSVVDPAKPDLVDLRDVKIVKKLGGTVDDTELVKGLIFDKKQDIELFANCQYHAEKLGYADLVKEVSLGDGKIVKITGIKDMGRTTTVLVRGLNRLVLDEAERSLHDALCVVRCLVNKRFLIAGGAAPEIELSRQLGTWAKVLQGMESYCVRSFAEALEVIPYLLAENADQGEKGWCHRWWWTEGRGGDVGSGGGGGRRVSGIDAVGGWVCGFGGS